MGMLECGMIRTGDVGRSSRGSEKLPFHEIHEETGDERTKDILAVQRETQK